MSGSSNRPVLGLTTYLQQARTGIWDVQASYLPASYINGVTRAGGTAVLLPPQPADRQGVARVLDGLDGLILTGGADIDPAAYGHQPHPATSEPGRDRDTWEFALVNEALRRQMPVLGICRGAQVVNVALGGTLHQHLPDLLGHTDHQKGNAVFNTSAVHIDPGTRLAGLVGASLDAQCYHHQAIDRIGAGLVVSARDGAGVVEAVELDRVTHPHTWAVAVQWHPEERLEDLRLFAGVVEAATAYVNRQRVPA